MLLKEKDVLLAEPKEIITAPCPDEIKTIGEDYIMWLFHNGEIEHLYKLPIWYNKVRLDILRRDNYECQLCKYERKLTVIRQRGYVHHMCELKQFPKLSLNYNNLVSLCYRCHEKTHGRVTTSLYDNIANYTNFNAEESW